MPPFGPVFSKARRSLAAPLALAAAALLLSPQARAVPSFARQTGFSCDMCHTQFPELTPFGRAFKASGYTMSTEKSISGKDSGRSTLELVGLPPLSAMLQTTYVHTQGTQVDGNGHPLRNDNIALPEQLSFFLAGKIAPNLGAFIQVTYSALDNSFGIDNTDIRYSQSANVGGSPLVWGLTLNNNPTLTDLWHDTPAFGIPFAGSEMAPGPSASPLISSLGQNTVGMGAYALWNNLVYAEVEGYRTSPAGMLPVVQTPSTATDVINGWAPYWRVALTRDFGPHSVEVGTYGMTGAVLAGDAGTLVAPASDFTDLALDAQYQYILGDNIFTADGSFIHENQSTRGTETSHLNSTTVSASYLFRRQIGVRATYLDAGGTADQTSHVVMADLNLVPWLNTQLILRYTANLEIDGATGSAASDKNSLLALAWIAF